MTIASKYNAAGIASNIDWSSMVDKLVQLDSQPIETLRQNQSALRAQVSTLGSLASKVAALQSAADALSGTGVLAVRATSTNTSFAAAPSTGALAGRYTVQIGDLAQAAKASSDPVSAGDLFAGGSLQVTVRGKLYSIGLTDGESIEDIAAAVRTSAAPVTANIISDGANKRLTFTNRDTGYPLDTLASDALVVTHVSDGNGKQLTVNLTQSAKNATFTVDGVSLTRTSNVVSDVIPGTTLTLKTAHAPAEDLVLENDVGGTAANLQKFVDAYNDVIKLVQSQLDVNKDTDRTTTLAGDTTVRSLQASLQNLLVAKVAGNDVRTLADVGIETARDGTISLNSKTLANAVSRNASAVNALFADPTKGLGALTDVFAKQYIAPVDGRLVTRQTNLNKTVSDMDDQAAQMQRRIDNYRQTLIQQFTAMESVISNLKASASFLTQSESNKG